MKASTIPKDPAARGFWLRWRWSPGRSWTELLCNDVDDLRREYRTQRTALKHCATAEFELYQGATRLTHLEDPR